jgi:hypothetical protein
MEISIGNLKIGKDTIIFNMGPATTCPSRNKGLCQVPDRCYAMKSERMYKQVLPFRKRQEQYWKKTPVREIAAALKQHLNRKFKVKIKYVRFNESGDFYSQFDVWKLQALASLVPDVNFYGFTARKDLDFSGSPDNLRINGSGFMLDNNFKAVPKDEVDNYDVKCGGNCRDCDLCKTESGKVIAVAYH